MHRFEIYSRSIFWNFLSYTGYLKEEEELCLPCQSWKRTVPGPLVSSTGWMKAVMGWYSSQCLWSISFKLCSQIRLRVRAVQCLCTVWVLQLTAAPLPGPVLTQLFRASQPAQAARDTSAPANCPHHLWSLMSLQLSSILYALLDSVNLPSDTWAALISSKFNSWQCSSGKLTQPASGAPFTSDLLALWSL